MEGPGIPDGQEQPQGHPDTLENKDPGAFSYAYFAATSFLSNYGWYVLFGLIAVIFVYKKLEPHLNKQKQRWDTAQEYKNYDPEMTRKRQEAMDSARNRLQEQHEAQAALYAEKQKQKEEEKRQANIEDWNRHQQGRGYRSKIKAPEEPKASSSQPKKNKTVYKQTDYNPLTGAGGGGAAFRPARRGGSSGG